MSTQEADIPAPVCATTREHSEDTVSRAATSILINKVPQEEKFQAETPDEPPSVEGDNFLTSPSMTGIHSEAFKISAEASKVIDKLVDVSKDGSDKNLHETENTIAQVKKTDEIEYAETEDDDISWNLTNDVSSEGQSLNDKHYVNSEKKEGNERTPAEKEIQRQIVNLETITYSDPTSNVFQSKNSVTLFESTVKESQGNAETQSKDLEDIATIGSYPKITEKEEDSSLVQIDGSQTERSEQLDEESEKPLSKEVSMSDIRENEPLAIHDFKEENNAELLEDEKDVRSSSKEELQIENPTESANAECENDKASSLEEQSINVNLQQRSVDEANNENINGVDTQGKVLESVSVTVSSSPEEGSIKVKNLQGQASDGIDGKTNNQVLVHEGIPVIVLKKENDENIYTEADDTNTENKQSLDEASLSLASKGDFYHDESSTLVSKVQLEARESELSGHGEENTLLNAEKTERADDILHAPSEHVEAFNLSQETEKVCSGEQNLDAHAQGLQEEKIEEKTVAIEIKEELLESQIDPKVVSNEMNEDNSVIQVGEQQMKNVEHVEEEPEKPSHVNVFLGNDNSPGNILDATENEDGNLGRAKLAETEIYNGSDSLKEELELEKSVESLGEEVEELKPVDLGQNVEKKGILAKQILLEKPDEIKVDEIVDATPDATETIEEVKELQQNVVTEVPQAKEEQLLTKTSTNDSNEDEPTLKDEIYGENEHERKVIVLETKKHIDSTLTKKRYSKDAPEDDTERPGSLEEQILTANHKVVRSEDIVDTEDTAPPIQNAETKTPDEKIEEKPTFQLDCSQIEQDNVSILAEAPAKESKNDESEIICESQNKDEDLTLPEQLQGEKNKVNNLEKEQELHEMLTDTSQASQDDSHQETQSSSIEEQVPTADGQNISSDDTEKKTSHAAGTDQETPGDIASNVQSGENDDISPIIISFPQEPSSLEVPKENTNDDNENTKASVASLEEESSKESINDMNGAIETSLMDKNIAGSASYEELEQSSRVQVDCSNIEQKEQLGKPSEMPSLANTLPGKTIEGNFLTEKAHLDKSDNSSPGDTEDVQSYSSTQSKEIDFIKDKTLTGDSHDKTAVTTTTNNSTRFDEIVIDNKSIEDLDIEMKDEAPEITGRIPSTAETQEVNRRSMGESSALITQSEKDLNVIANIGSIIQEKSDSNEAEVEQEEVTSSYVPKNKEYRFIEQDQSQPKEEDTETEDSLKAAADIESEKAGEEDMFQINEPAYEKETTEVDISSEKIKKEDEDSEDIYPHSSREEGTTESFPEDDLKQEEDTSTEEKPEIIKSDGTEKVSAIQIKNEDEEFAGDYHQGSSKSEVVTGSRRDDVKEDQTEKVEDKAEAGQTEKLSENLEGADDTIRPLQESLEANKPFDGNTRQKEQGGRIDKDVTNLDSEEAHGSDHADMKAVSEDIREKIGKEDEDARDYCPGSSDKSLITERHPEDEVLAGPEADQKVIEQLEEESRPTEYNDISINEKEHKSAETVTTVFDSKDAHGLDHSHVRIESEDPTEKIVEQEDAKENIIAENCSEDEAKKEDETKIEEEFEITKDTSVGKLSQGLADDDHEIIQQPTKNSGLAKPIDRSTDQKERGESIATVITLLDDKEAYVLDHAHAMTESEDSRGKIEKQEEDAKESIIAENHSEDELSEGLEEDKHEAIQEPKENSGAAEPTDRSIHQKEHGDSMEPVITVSARKEVHGSDHTHAKKEIEESSEKIEEKEDVKEGINVENPSEYEVKKEDNTKIEEKFELTGDEEEKLGQDFDEDHEIIQQPRENSGAAEPIDRSINQKEQGENIDTIITVVSKGVYGLVPAHAKTEDEEESSEKIEKKEDAEESINIENHSDEAKKKDDTTTEEQSEVPKDEEEKLSEGLEEDEHEAITQPTENSGTAEPNARSIDQKEQTESIERVITLLDNEEAYGLDHAHAKTESENSGEKIEKEEEDENEGISVEYRPEDEVKKEDQTKIEEQFEVTKDSNEGKVSEGLEEGDHEVMQQPIENSGAAEPSDRSIHRKGQVESIETGPTVLNNKEAYGLDHAHAKTESEDTREKIEKEGEDATNTEEEFEVTKDTTETKQVAEKLENTDQNVLAQLKEVSGAAEIIDIGIHQKNQGKSLETATTVVDSEEVTELDGAYIKIESEDKKKKIEKEEEDAKEENLGSPEEGIIKVSDHDDVVKKEDYTNTQEELEGTKDTIKMEHIERVSERLEEVNQKVTEQPKEVSREAEIIGIGVHEKKQGESIKTVTTAVDSEEVPELDGAFTKTESEDSKEKIKKQEEVAKEYHLGSLEEGLIKGHQDDVVKKAAETNTEEELEGTKDTTETEQVEKASERLEETNQKVIEQPEVSGEVEIIDRGIHEKQKEESIEIVTKVVDGEEVPVLDCAYINVEREDSREKIEEDTNEYHLGSLKEGTVKESQQDNVEKKEDETNREEEFEVANSTFQTEQVGKVSERLEEADQNVREQLKEVSGEEEQGESFESVKNVVDSEEASGLDGEYIKLEREGSSEKEQIEKEEEAAKEYNLGPPEEGLIKKTDDEVNFEDETNTEEKHEVREETKEKKQVSQRLEEVNQKVTEQLEEDPGANEIIDRGINQKKQGENVGTATTGIDNEKTSELDSAFAKIKIEDSREKIEKEEEDAKVYRLGSLEEEIKQDDVVKEEDETNKEELKVPINTIETEKAQKVSQGLEEADELVTEQLKDVSGEAEITNKGIHKKDQGDSIETVTTVVGSEEASGLDGGYVKTGSEGPIEKIEKEEELGPHDEGLIKQRDDVVKIEDVTNTEERHENTEETNELEQVYEVSERLEEADQKVTEQPKEVSLAAEIIDRGIHRKEQGESIETATTVVDKEVTPELDSAFAKIKIEDSREKIEKEEEDAKEYRLGSLEEEIKQDDAVKEEDETNKEELKVPINTIETEKAQKVSQGLEEADELVTEQLKGASGEAEIANRGIHKKDQGDSIETVTTVVGSEEASGLDGGYVKTGSEGPIEKIEKEAEDAKEYHLHSREEGLIKETHQGDVVKKEDKTYTIEELNAAKDKIETEQVEEVSERLEEADLKVIEQFKEVLGATEIIDRGLHKKEQGKRIMTITTVVESEEAPGLDGANVNTESEESKEKIKKEEEDAIEYHLGFLEDGIIKESQQNDAVKKEDETNLEEKFEATNDANETEQAYKSLDETDGIVTEHKNENSGTSEAIKRSILEEEHGEGTEKAATVFDRQEFHGIGYSYIRPENEGSTEKIEKEDEDAKNYSLGLYEEGRITESGPDGEVTKEDEEKEEENIEGTNELKQAHEGLEEDAHKFKEHPNKNLGEGEPTDRSIDQKELREYTEKVITVLDPTEADGLDARTKKETEVSSSSVALRKDEENRTGADDVHKETDTDQELPNQTLNSPLVDAAGCELLTEGIHRTKGDSEDNKENATIKIVQEEEENKKMVVESPSFPGFTNEKERKEELKDYIYSSEEAPAKDEEKGIIAAHVREIEVPKGDIWDKPTEGEAKHASIEAENVDFPSSTNDKSEIPYSDSVDITPLSEKDYPDKSIGTQISTFGQYVGLLEQASKATTVATEIVETKPGSSSGDLATALDTREEHAVETTSTDEYVVVEADDANNVIPESSSGSKAISDILHGNSAECSQGEDGIRRPSVLKQIEPGHQEVEITSKETITPGKKPESEETHEHSQLSLLHSSMNETSQITDHPTIQEEPATHSEYPHTDNTYETVHKEATGDVQHDDGDEHEYHATENVGDAEVKTVHKKPHSHNLLSGVGSKVKHSLDKVKKAITGKSHHSKQRSPK